MAYHAPYTAYVQGRREYEKKHEVRLSHTFFFSESTNNKYGVCFAYLPILSVIIISIFMFIFT